MKKLFKNSPLKYDPPNNGGGNVTTPPTPFGGGQYQGNYGTTDPRPSTDECPTFDPLCNPVFVLEKHISVIRKGPTSPPTLSMYKFEEERAEVSEEGDVEGKVKAFFTGARMWGTWNFCNYPHTPCFPAVGYTPNTRGRGFDGEDISEFYHPSKAQKKAGDTIVIPIDVSQTNEDWEVNDKLTITHEYTDVFGDIKKAVAMVSINSVDNIGAPGNTLSSSDPSTYFTSIQQIVNQGEVYPDTDGIWGSYGGSIDRYIIATIISITGNFPKYVKVDDNGAPTGEDIYRVHLVQNPALFKHKFPKFAYRYKYEDGEYSVFSPWSEIAFIPETFDYLPKKGYNLGMENAMRSLRIKDFVPKDIPEDVIQVDLLYKESNAPAVYTVASFKRDDPIEAGNTENYWNTPGTGDNRGNYRIKSELIHKVVPSNQMLRPWDNVPKRAAAQEITANRLIFANYLQNYDVKDSGNDLVTPLFSVNINQIDHSITTSSTTGPRPGEPAKSLKSMRTYQLGIVYRDRYGRETPVLTGKSGSFKLSKEYAVTQNRLQVQMESNPPYWAESYTFYIKETSNEYYNLAMDRWYDAEDGGIWLSFPSSERNKISDRTTLLLKKQHDSYVFTEQEIDYKVLSIKNDAPTFIKTDLKYWGSLPMMLPPPGWGDVGNWDSGMFYPTGLPLPLRMYIDVYAEYWDQSVMRSLSNRDGAQIRIIQSAGQASAYNSGTSDSTNKSRWYNVANIEYIGAPAQTYEEAVEDPSTSTTITTEVEESGQMAQIVRISLEKAFGNDVSFCMPGFDDQFSQPSNLSLERGLSLEARTKDVKDQAQFEGRFFVKVLRDFNIEQNIVNPQQDFAERWQVLQSKDIRYIAAGHPGLQDWCPQVGNTICDNAFIPIGQEDLSTGYPNIKEVSSLSRFHTTVRAEYIDASGGVQLSPTYGGPGDNWPLGPSEQDTEGLYHADPYLSAYGHYLDGSDNFPDAHADSNHDWPSFMPGKWVPFMCVGDCASQGNIPWAQKVTWGTNPAQQPYSDYDAGPPTPASPGSLLANAPSSGILDLSEAVNTSGFNQTVGGSTAPWDPSGDFLNNGYLDGINPFQLPAIWGNQEDFLASPPVFDDGTAEKLREDWYHLWRGRDDVFNEWPLGRFHPNRWIFDKAGAAEGYSGNGIWNDGDVSYMDLAYWGIGKETEYSRKNTNGELMRLYHQTEVAFADAMSTVGTQFRFAQDPDQTVYTITNVRVQEEVWNYEAPQGVWAVDDGAGNPMGGSGIGYERFGPWGGTGDNAPLPGGYAFLSDIMSKDKKLTGGAPYNRRIRFTLTLDKIIGLEGGVGFHPITNHVDAEGNANVKGGKAQYGTNLLNVTSAKGGTTTGLEFYNLASYWSQSSTPTTDQADDKATNDSLGMHIGLHERGLNETTIEIVTPYKGDDDSRMSTNPAVWETEPLEDVGLDIYYAASPSYPVKVKRFRWDHKLVHGPDEPDFYNANWYDYGLRGEEIISVGSEFTPVNNSIDPYPATSTICAVQNNTIWLMPLANSPGGSAFVDVNGDDIDLDIGCEIRISFKGEGSYYGAGYDREEITLKITQQMSRSVYKVELDTHGSNRQLNYFNCYSYGTGIESNRIRDDFNAVQIDKGVKASMPLAEQYKEERKGSSLIFSGIYNSTSGINRTNQFIQAEPITKDLNPVNGSIQKLFARDTDLITFCENKVFKILAKKDALFNADGNTNVTSNTAVLGQTIPFNGEYGISKNPESFASESYRAYFADKSRGAILRLSRDGLVPISDSGMKDWFKDNLRFASSIIGSFDDREDQYNITIETRDQDNNLKAYTVSWVESKKGWESFKSFITQGGISHKNIYYTFPSNNYSHRVNKDPWGVSYAVPGIGRAETWQHHLDLIIKRNVQVTSTSNSSTIIVQNGTGTLIPGMNVEGNGIHIDTLITAVNCSGPNCTVLLNYPAWVENGDEIKFTTARNSFYGNDDHYSMLKVVFNQAQGSVKRFKTLDYEGTQAKTIERTDNRHIIEGVDVGQIYYDNYAKRGWYVENMFTDMQEGYVPEFLNKENKWYNFINGGNFGDGSAGRHDHIDTSEFSLQGLGYSDSTTVGPPPPPPPDPTRVSWNCLNGACVDPLNGTGQYTDDNSGGNPGDGLTACQTACGALKETWDCDGNGNCFDPGDESGQYSDRPACEAACITPQISYNCQNSGTTSAQCVDPGDGSGTYTGANALNDCINNCAQAAETWNCVLHLAGTSPHYYSVDTYDCEDPGDGTGTYTTQSACIGSCVPPPPASWDCDTTAMTCIDPGDGSGFYTSQATCLANCREYCDDSAGGVGCNTTGAGAFVGSCDPTVCVPASPSYDYYLWCLYDDMGGSLTHHYFDEATMISECGPGGLNHTLVPGDKFHNSDNVTCWTFIGTHNGTTPPSNAYVVTALGTNWNYANNFSGCLMMQGCSNCNLYVSGDPTAWAGCNQCDSLVTTTSPRLQTPPSTPLPRTQKTQDQADNLMRKMYGNVDVNIKTDALGDIRQYNKNEY